MQLMLNQKPLQFLDKATLLRLATRAAVLLIACVFGQTYAAAQSQGGMVGEVTDTTGARIVGASISVTSLQTGEKRHVLTNASGEFRLVDLLPASYKVEVDAPAFKHFILEAETVQVDAVTRVDAVLQLGAADQTVVVTAEAPLLQTDSGTLGFEVSGKQVQETPLNGRNPLNLIALVPGVVPQGASGGSAGENQLSRTFYTGWGNYQIGGGIAGQSAQFLDGAPINVLGGNTVALVPTQDFIQEFRVSTNAVTPEFGRFGGGVVEFGTKSGSNAWHGTIYEYFRNNVLNANDFFSKLAGDPRPKWNQNQYGAAIGGPLKRDKAFVFFSWEGFRTLLGESNPVNTTTQQMQEGVFTKPITDPTGRCAIVHDPVAATWTVPSTCWDSVGSIMKTFYPLPLTPDNPVNNYYVAPVAGTNANQYNVRVDTSPSEKQRIFARYSYWPLQDIPPNEYSSAGGYRTGNAYEKAAAHQAVLGDTFTISPTLIVDGRLSYLRSFFDTVPPSLGFDLSTFGPAYAALGQQVTFKALPTPFLAGPDGFWGFFPATDIARDRWNTYAASGSVTKEAGRHLLKFGGSGRLMQRAGFGDFNNPSGRFNFSPQYTGDEFASLLLGAC